jgi:hypothetical protein
MEAMVVGDGRPSKRSRDAMEGIQEEDDKELP